MPSNAVAVDVSQLIEARQFGATELSGARVAIRESKEARAAAEAATQDLGTDAAAALRRGTGLYLLGRLREAAAALALADDSPQARLVRGRAAL